MRRPVKSVMPRCECAMMFAEGCTSMKNVTSTEDDGVEVTPEMAEAGALVLEEHGYTQGDYGNDIDRFIAEKIFKAMLSVSREQRKERP